MDTKKPSEFLANDLKLDMNMRLETTSIMFVDVVESVRLVEQNELVNVLRIRTLLKSLSDYVVPKFHGLVLERRGDGLLIRFDLARSAARCAAEIHLECESINAGIVENALIFLRIGIHRAEVISDDHAIYGQGINLASRVASLAGPGETVVSGSVRDSLVAGIDCEVDDLGDCYLKHIPEPIRAFRLGQAGPEPKLPTKLTDLQDSLPSIAILPFEAMGDTRATIAADLLGETLTHCLARAGSLKVLAWMSSKAVLQSGLSIGQAGKLLKADWIVAGSCRVFGEKIIVSAQLVQVETELITHSERLHESLSDLLEPESSLAATLSNVLVRAVTESEARRVSKHALPSLSAHSLLLGAIGLMHRSGPIDFLRGKDALEHLLDRQPRMHSARPWLAKWYVLRTTRGMSTPDLPEAKMALEQTTRALDSRDDDAFALAIQGCIYFHMFKDIPRASEKLSLAVQINPNEPMASVFNAALVNAKGEFELAWELSQRALSLSPYDPLRAYMRMIAAASALTTERYAAAVELAMQSIKENAAHPAAWRTLVIALALDGQVAQARESALKLLQIEPALTVKSYSSRITWGDPIKSRVVEALRMAGLPAD